MTLGALGGSCRKRRRGRTAAIAAVSSLFGFTVRAAPARTAGAGNKVSWPKARLKARNMEASHPRSSRTLALSRTNPFGLDLFLFFSAQSDQSVWSRLVSYIFVCAGQRWPGRRAGLNGPVRVSANVPPFANATRGRAMESFELDCKGDSRRYRKVNGHR